MKLFIQKSRPLCKKWATRSAGTVCLLSWSLSSFANDIIPIPDDYKVGGAHGDVLSVGMKIFQKGLLPLMAVCAGGIVLWEGLGGIWSGYKNAQTVQDFKPLKDAMLRGAFFMGVGGFVIWLLVRLSTYQF